MVPLGNTQRVSGLLFTAPLAHNPRDFVLDVAAGNRTESTVSFYRQKLTRFVDYLQEQDVEQGSELTANHIRGFLSQLGRDHNRGHCHAYYGGRCIAQPWRYPRADAAARTPEQIVTAENASDSGFLSIDLGSRRFGHCRTTAPGPHRQHRPTVEGGV